MREDAASSGRRASANVMEGWRFNPPRSWPVEAGYEPERGWRPPEAWGPLPPGHQLWLPEHPRPRRTAPSVLALFAVTGLVSAAFVLPGTDATDARAARSVAWRSDIVVSDLVARAGPVEAALPSSPISRKPTKTHPVRRFHTCAQLREKYPHGVGLRTADDRTGGRTGVVTDFTRNARVYAANKARDGDRDGIACEHA